MAEPSTEKTPIPEESKDGISVNINNNENEIQNDNSWTSQRRLQNKILLYDLQQKPSLIVSTFVSLQIVTVVLLNVVWVPSVLTPSLCIHPDDPARIQIISLTVFASGLSTMIFSTIGIRLPVLLLPNISYLNSMLKILKLPGLTCPGAGDLYAMGHINRTQEWYNRIGYLQGGILMTSVLQLGLGLTGMSAIFDSVISNPLVLIPSTIVLGYSYANEIINMTTTYEISSIPQNSSSWGIIFLTVSLLIMTAFKFHKLEFVTLNYSFSKGFSTSNLRLFKIFPVFVTSFLVLVIYPLLLKLIYGSTYEKRTLDQAFVNAEPYYLHKPFPFGWPVFYAEAFLGLLPSVVSQMFLSSLIYRVTNFIYGKNVKGRYVSRGILLEGVSSSVAGIFAVNSVSSPMNIGLMQLTGVGNRCVVLLTGIILIIFSVYTNSLRYLVSISPIFVLTVVCILSALLSVTGLFMMEKMNYKSIRSYIVIGLSLYAGIVIPDLMSTISSEYEIFTILIEIFRNNVTTCALTAFILDCTLPDKNSSENPCEPLEMSENDWLEHYELTTCEEILACCL